MDSTTEHALLNVDIPYRLESIALLSVVCDWLSWDIADRPATLTLDDGPVLFKGNLRLFTNPVFEIGTIYCRVLLEFLGLKEGKNGELITAPSSSRRHLDVRIEASFGTLKMLTPNDVTEAPFGKVEERQRACVTTIQVANRAVAHLVRGGGPAEHLKEVRLCADIVPWLVEKHLYEPLRIPMPPSQIQKARER